MAISFSDRVRVPDDVLISNLQEESVILNLDNERYYGLDDVGTNPVGPEHCGFDRSSVRKVDPGI